MLLLRYAKHDAVNNDWEITERFIQFKDFCRKTGKEIADMIENVLQDHGMDIADCRGQGYDSGANMSGKIKRVQAHIMKKNPLATYSSCAAHTLNLVGVHAAESSPEVATFFGNINCLYSASPERWAILRKKTGCSLHKLPDTCWSARIDTVRPIAEHLPSVMRPLRAYF